MSHTEASLYEGKHENIGLDKQNFQRKTVNIFLPIIFSIFFGAQKNSLIETICLSTHNICFG